MNAQDKIFEILWLILLKLSDTFHFFWAKIALGVIWTAITFIFHLQPEAHTALSVLIVLDGIMWMAHSTAKWEFDQRLLLKKFGIKMASYAIVILTCWAIDLALTKWHASFGFHYTAIVFLALTEASSISNHLEVFNIKLPFRNKIKTMLANMYDSK